MFQQEINQYLTTHHYTRIDLKAVLFDMDGVLFDSMKNHATRPGNEGNEAIRNEP